MITIFRAGYFNGRAFVSSWHASGAAAWSAIRANEKKPQANICVIHPGAEVEPVDVITTRDGVIRLLNKLEGR